VLAPTPHVNSTNVEWVCVRSVAVGGVPLGMPLAPDCPTRTATAPIRSRAVGAAAAIPAPTNFAATVSGTTVVLNWSASAAPVTSYVIEAGSFFGYSDLASFDTGTAATSIAVLNVPARIYWVRVRARIGADVSDPSNEISVRVDGGNCAATLYAPLTWRASGAGSSVTLTWDLPNLGCPPTEYIIEAGSTRGATDLAHFRTGTPVPRYDANGVGPGTYYVRVRSANDVGVSYPTSEKIMVFGTGCFYSVTSTVNISRGAVPQPIAVETGPGCAWTMTADASWLLTAIGSALPTAGEGSRTVPMNVSVNVGPPRTGTVMVRWPGGGADVAVSQNGNVF
jgi:hypothetical protein